MSVPSNKINMRLAFEPLESRRLLAILRMASWNTANNPDDAFEDAEMATILEAIGNESVAGNAEPLALLAVQETDLPTSGGDSLGRIETILEDLYPNSEFATAATSLDGGGDATGFIFNTGLLSLTDSEEFDVGFTHNSLRGTFRPTGTFGESDFSVYVTHLKAGNASSDRSRRAAEASLLRADMDALGVGAQIILAGDLNVRSSNETSFSTFVSPGVGQLFDPVSSPGTWHDNAAFRGLHTQNPKDPTNGGGGMDDRFDFQLISGELLDGVGIDYVAASYRAFGNNGTHQLNQSITTGTGATPEVLAALASVSDHLPVVADYEIFPMRTSRSSQATGIRR